jgi:glycosyltransferase involved in cell wall biosynthesis
MQKSLKIVPPKNTAGLPLITIITVVYNAEIYLEKTIKSVLDQSYKNIEYIIIDGASTDGTLAIIDKYSQQLAYYVSEPDKGIYDAMNKAINVAAGDWVYFLPAGDTLIDNILSNVADKLTDANCVYYGDVYRTDLKRLYDGKYSAFKLAVHNICQQAIFYPLSAVKKYRFNLKYRSLADHEVNMKLFGDKSYSFKYLPVTISTYEGGGFSELNLDHPFYADKLGIIQKNFPFIVFLYAYTRTFIARIVKPGYLKPKAR